MLFKSSERLPLKRPRERTVVEFDGVRLPRPMTVWEASGYVSRLPDEESVWFQAIR